MTRENHALDHHDVGRRLQVRTVSWRLIGWLAGIFVAVLVFAEIVLSPPNADERLHLMAILGAPALVTALLVPFLGKWDSARTSVAGTALLVGLCSLTLGAVTTSAASNAMFLSAHDYRLFLVVLLMSSSIALAVGSHLARDRSLPTSPASARLPNASPPATSLHARVSHRTRRGRPHRAGR